MSQTLTEPRVGAGGGGDDVVVRPGFGDYGSGGGPAAHRMDTAKLGLWIVLGSITMLFASFTSAYIVRSTGADWVPLAAPPLVWVNSLVLVLSSVSVELARRRFRSWRPVSFRRWVLATAGLGAMFLVGQIAVWQQLMQQGIYLASHPHSSFFYVLTGVHGVHLLAGVLALFYVLVLATRYELTPGESSSPELAATYWHFVDLLWLYLVAVLFFV